MAAHYLSEMRQVHPGGPWRLAGYCFGAILAFEIANQLIAEGEQVELLASFNGPSPAWLKRWVWYGNQPSWRAAHPGPSQATKGERRRKSLRSAAGRARRAVREPGRLVSWAEWRLRRPYTAAALALGRPVPERLREDYFLDLHGNAERAYEPSTYQGELIVFHGEDLYEDPTLGWEGLAAGGIRSYAVPGEHGNNRHAMLEPAVEFVKDRLHEYMSENRRTSRVEAAKGER